MPYTTISNAEGGAVIDRRDGTTTPVISPRDKKLRQFDLDIQDATDYMSQAKDSKERAEYAQMRAKLIAERKMFIAGAPDTENIAGPNVDPSLAYDLATGALADPVTGGQEPAGNGTPIDEATAQEFFNQAGGDAEKARELAKKAGYTF